MKSPSSFSIFAKTINLKIGRKKVGKSFRLSIGAAGMLAAMTKHSAISYKIYCAQCLH